MIRFEPVCEKCGDNNIDIEWKDGRSTRLVEKMEGRAGTRAEQQPEYFKCLCLRRKFAWTEDITKE